MGRDHLGLYGSGRGDAGTARSRNGLGAALASLRFQEMAGLQLGAVHGGFDRHRALHVRASVLRQGGERDPRRQEALREPDRAHECRSHALDRRGPAARDQDQSASGGTDHRRRPAHRLRQYLLAHRTIFDAVSLLCAEPDAEREAYDKGNGVIAEVDENYVPLRHKGNNYLIDRKLQKTKSYTGIRGVSEQDAAVQDSQGPIADRSREHLGPTDLGIMHFRKLMLETARALQQGIAPPHVDHQDRYAVRSGACVTNKAKDLTAVMVERFGDATGFVGRPTIAAAE